MKKVFTISCFLLTLFVGVTKAQEESSESFKDRIFYGGNFGLQFGGLTYVDISPLIGYKFTERIHGGIGATYIYFHYKDIFNEYETNVFGGRVFGRYYVYENLFAHTEYEVVNLDIPHKITNQPDVYRRGYLNSIFIGGGYIQPIGERSGITLMLLFNLIEKSYSPYENPIIRIGINAGL